MIEKLHLSGPLTKVKFYFLGGPIPISLLIKEALDCITDFRHKLKYFNDNIQSLSLCGMEGQIYVTWGEPSKELKIYSGSAGARALEDFDPDHEKIFLELRAAEVERLTKAISNTTSYKEQLTILFDTPGFNPDIPNVKICKNFSYNEKGYSRNDMAYAAVAINYYPTNANEIATYNVFVRASFEKMYFLAGRFSEDYCGFDSDKEMQKLHKSLEISIDPKLLIETRIAEIEQYFNYPSSLSEDEHSNSVLKEIHLEMGQSYTRTEFFAAKALGQELDLNRSLLSTSALLLYTHVSEVFKFYSHLISLRKNGYSMAEHHIEEITSINYSGAKMENNFDKVPIDSVYEYFKKGLVSDGLLTKEELTQFLDLAFQKKVVPDARFKLKNIRTKQKVLRTFYIYYKEIAGKPHNKQQEYAALLGEYFEGFNTKNVSSNFNK